jgi:hypothetical protein
MSIQCEPCALCDRGEYALNVLRASPAFDTRSNESLVSAARKLILKSGKKKSNKMANLQLMHPKYKDELEKDDDLKFIYGLLGSAGITRAFMNFYPPGGSFKFHRDEFLEKFGPSPTQRRCKQNDTCTRQTSAEFRSEPATTTRP